MRLASRSTLRETTSMTSLDSRRTDILSDASWLAHRFEEAAKKYHFLLCPREKHREVTFITDEYLSSDLPLEIIGRSVVAGSDIASGPVHYIFHSAYCCSTLLGRAFDIEGISMGLKEPVILNDMVGWLRRNGDPSEISQTLDTALALLSRPFQAGEATIIKPSNIVNRLAFTMMSLRPEAKALLLYAPLENYLRSIAKKNMWGRLWVRELFAGLVQDRTVIGGLSGEEMLRLTDLQVAALGWISQHALFAELHKRFPERVRSIDSETMLAAKNETIEGLSQLFGLGLDDKAITDIVDGPAFSSHSKSQDRFTETDRAKEQTDTAALHAEEIAMVVVWAQELMKANGISSDLPGRLLR